MSAADYVGIATCITSLGAVIVSIIVAIRQTETHAQLTKVNAQVATSNGKTMGEIVEGYEDRRVGDHE